MASDVRLPDIKASVKVDSKDVDAGLKRVQSSTGAAGKSFEGLRGKASGAVDSISSSLTSKLGPASGAAESALGKLSTTGSLMGPAIAGGAALAGAAVAKFALDGAQQFVALAGEVRNFQRASGASAEDSSRFVAALDDLGIKSETGASALFKLGKKAADGGGDLAKLGIEVAHAKDGTVDLTGTLLNVADQYVKTTDPAKRAELAFQAFGKQGQELVPVLEQGRQGLEAFFKGAEGGRQIFSQEDLDKARKYELAIDDLQDTFRGLKLQAGEALLPFLTTLAEAGTKTLGSIDKVKEKAPGIFEGMKSAAVGAVGGPIAQVIDGLSKVGGKSDSTKKSTKELAEEIKASALASQEDARAKEEQAAALDRVTDATRSAVSSQLGYQGALNTLLDNINDIDDRTEDYRLAVEAAATAHDEADAAVRRYGVGSDQAREAVEKAKDADKDAEAANRSLRDAHLAVETSAIAAANAAVKLGDDTAAASGKTLTAQERSDIFRAALVELANQADGPTKQSILDLADKIKELPDRTVTVDANTGAAHTKLDSLEARLDYLARRGVSIENDSNTGTAGDPEARAGGGPVYANRPYIVGETRPELFIPAVNGRIVPQVPAAPAGMAPSAPAGWGTGDIVLKVNDGVLARLTLREVESMRQSYS